MTILQSIRRTLRPGGVMIVIDFEKIPGESSEWAMRHVRADKQTVIREIEGAGFQLQNQEDFLKVNYFLRFTRAN